MKKRSIVWLAVLSLGLFISCNNDDNVDESPEIIGTWNLKNVNGGFPFRSIDYQEGLVAWRFQSNNLLTVENTIVSTGPEDVHAILDSGTYNYEILQEESAELLVIDGTTFGEIIQLDGNTLKVDDGVASDGLMFLYKK